MMLSVWVTHTAMTTCGSVSTFNRQAKQTTAYVNFVQACLRCFVMTRNGNIMAYCGFGQGFCLSSVSAAEHTQTIKEFSQVAHEHWLNIMKHGWVYNRRCSCRILSSACSTGRCISCVALLSPNTGSPHLWIAPKEMSGNTFRVKQYSCKLSTTCYNQQVICIRLNAERLTCCSDVMMMGQCKGQ